MAGSIGRLQSLTIAPRSAGSAPQTRTRTVPSTSWRIRARTAEDDQGLTRVHRVPLYVGGIGGDVQRSIESGVRGAARSVIRATGLTR